LVRDGAVIAWRIPPGGIRGNLYPRRQSNLSVAAHQADVAFLDQVQKLQPAIRIFFGNGDYQAQVAAVNSLLACCASVSPGESA